MFQKKALHSRSCRFGCPDTENPHHVFVVCPRFSELRGKELLTLTASIKKRLDDAELSLIDQQPLIQTAKFIFSDSDAIWPLRSATFFLGQIPKIEPLVSSLSIQDHVTRSRLIHNVASDMHLSSVRLASRIFGDLQKVMSKRHAELYGPKR
jgi:hypothetical protein